MCICNFQAFRVLGWPVDRHFPLLGHIGEEEEEKFKNICVEYKFCFYHQKKIFDLFAFSNMILSVSHCIVFFIEKRVLNNLSRFQKIKFRKDMLSFYVLMLPVISICPQSNMISHPLISRKTALHNLQRLSPDFVLVFLKN